MTELDKLVENLKKNNSSVKQAQLRFVTCESVDWENKTMTAVGVADDVKYEDIVLGFGYMDIKPAKDSVCLIGIVEGNEALSFLINAEIVELVEITADKIQFNGGDNQGLINIKKLQDRLNALEKAFNDHKHILGPGSIVIVPQSMSNGAPVQVPAILSKSNQFQTETNHPYSYEDDKITH